MKNCSLCHFEGAAGDRRNSKYEMLRFAQHDKENKEYVGWALPTDPDRFGESNGM